LNWIWIPLGFNGEMDLKLDKKLQLKFYGIGWEFEIGIKLVFDLDLYFNSIGL
jgi:hypothetical protein